MKRKADNISTDEYDNENNYDTFASFYIIKPFNINENNNYDNLFLSLVDAINNCEFNISS